MHYANKRSRAGSIDIILIIILVLLILGGIGWYVYSKRSTKSESVATSTQTTASEPDSVDTLESPTKITTADGKRYFYYGAPAGQNNADPKRIIISLPGHGTKAEDDYAAWLPHIKGGKYALASL